MIRPLLSRHLALTPAIAFFAVIAFAAPAGAQYASCNALSGNTGPAWNPGSYSLGGASYYIDANTNYGSGSTGSDAAAQAACQSFSQGNGLSGVCQDYYTYNYNVSYISPSNPNFWMCQVEICQSGGTTYQWSYSFYPGVNALGYVAPQSGSYSTDDGSWVNSVSWQYTSDAGVCTYTPPPTPPTASLSASPSAIAQGNGTTLYWNSTNASWCTGTNFSTGGAPSGAVAVYPGSSTYYAVTCGGAGGTASAGYTVTVYPRPVVWLNVNGAGSATVANGTAVTLNWGSAYASSCSITNIGAVGGSGSTATTPPSNTTTTYTFSCSGSGGSASASVSVTTYQPLPADLTASVGSVVSGYVGTSQTFTGTASNIGPSATTGGFWNLLQICNTNCASYNNYTNEVWTGTLGAGASTPLSLAATLPSSPGTYYYRFCANENTSLQNIVTESNYGNDCSGWQTVNVYSPVTASCSVAPANGQVLPTPTSFTWSAFPSGGNGSYTSYSWSSGGNTGTGNPWSTTYSAAGTYGATVTVRDSVGNSSGAITCSSQATVTRCGTATPSITTNNTIVKKGQQATISWSASGVNSSCTITGSDGFTETDTPPANTCAIANGQHAATINTQTVYKIVCDGSQTATVVVNVVPGFTEY